MSSKKLPEARIAVVGGTHINDYIFTTDCLEGSAIVETAAGDSPEIHYGWVGDEPFLYVHFHGEGKWLTTWLALRDLGVTDVIGGATVGSVSPLMQVGDIVIPDDFLDRNQDRIDRVPVEHLADPSHAICRFTPPCDERLCEILVAVSRAVLREDPGLGSLNIFDRGTVIQSRSGRFETAAEIAEYARAGADIVTHNIVTEMVFAKQLGLHFAPLHLVSNPAEGVAPWTFESISELYLKMNPVCWRIIESAIPRIAAIPTDAPRTLDRQRAHPPLSYRDALARAKAT